MESNNEVPPNIDSDVGATAKVESEVENIAHGEDASNPISVSPEGVAETMAEKSEPMDIAEAGDAGNSANNLDLGIDDEMKAMFGEESTPEAPPAQENVLDNGPGGESVVARSDQVVDESKTKCDLDQTPDESNLEDMMEALHADKVESPQAVQKQAETSGLELKDVLQALTGDLEESSNDCGDKQKAKDAGDTKSVKRRTELEMLKESAAESDGSSERTLRVRSKTKSTSSDSKKTTDTKSQPKKSIRKASESEDEGTSEEDVKAQTKKRGRPSKKKDADKSNDNSSDDEEKSHPKRRGRPSKNKDKPDSDESDVNSSIDEEKPQPKKRGRPPKKKDTDKSDENSSDEEKVQPKMRGRPAKKKPKSEKSENTSGEEDSKSMKPGSRKSRKKSDESKDQEKGTSKTTHRKPGPKSSRPKSVEGDSDSDISKSRKGRKPLPGTDLVSKSNKVCIISDCRQQCFPQLGISLHRFPIGPGSIRKYWLKLVNHEPPGPTTAYICSKHFTESDYNYDAKKDPSETFYRKLKPGAIPSVALPINDKVFQKVKADVEIWKKTDMKAAEGSIVIDSSRKKKAGRSHEKSGGGEGKSEVQAVDSEEEDEGEADSKGNAGGSGAGPSKAHPPKPNKEQSEEAKKPDKGKRAASRSPSPAALQPSSAKTPAPMIRKKPETETRGRTPGTNCSVPCCGNNLFETRAEGLNISYYRFPFDNSLADKWIKKIGDSRLNARTARICSDHFADKDFDGTGGGRRNLKPKAVPSLYLTEKKPRDGGTDMDDEEEDKMFVRKKSKSKSGGSKRGKPDTSFISMPLPIIEDIKSEPPTDDEMVGQDYAPEDPGSELEEPVPAKKIKMEKGTNQPDEDDDSNDKENEVRTLRGRSAISTSATAKVKTVSLASLALPVVSLERLGKRVIDAADSGSLRVRIKESDKAVKPAQKHKPGPKSKRKRVDSDTESSPVNQMVSRPGPLSKKKVFGKIGNTPAEPKRYALQKRKKLLKLSDNESDSDIDNPPSPMLAENDIPEKPTTYPVEASELSEADEQIGDGICDEMPEDIDAIVGGDKSDKEKIIRLVEQRISEHTKIIEGKTMGAQQLADHNKILQGSALVLKKLAEKSGKPSPVLPLGVPADRTIVLRKVADPNKLGLKPPVSRVVVTAKDSLPSSPSKSPLLASPLNSARSTPNKFSKSALGEDAFEGRASSHEKIRDYDNLMKKYLSAVLDKNVMSKKYTECKEAQKVLEIRLAERNKEVELLKRKVSTLQAKISRTNSSLEYFLTPNQIKLALQETKKVAWSPEEMLTAFTIKHLSKACYLFLRHKLNYPLPGISSLQRWMTMLSKDKAEDDEDNIADEDVSDKEESQEILEEGPGVVNEITGTLEEINACGAPGDENYQPGEGGENVKDSNQSSPFQVVFENDGNSNSNRKVIILKKMPKEGNGKMKMKSKLQISASENDVNVSNIEESDEKNELYKLLPGAKTISMASSPVGSQKRRFVVPKKMTEKEKISFQRLPQVRKDMSAPKPPRIQIVKNEPHDEFVNQQFDEGVDPNSESHMIQVAASDLVETVVKPEMVTQHGGVEQQQEESPRKFFTISDLNSTQMEEHIVENVEHVTEDGVQKAEGGDVMHETLVSGDGMQSITIVKEGHMVEHHSGEAIQGMVAMAGNQQITFATAEDISRGHFAQIAYAQGQHGEITLHEDINNMTAVVINDIDDEQLNTLLLSNVVEQKGVEIQGDQAYGHKKIVYQTIDQDKNVIVLQPDSQAFIEEDEGTSGGAPRVYIINDEGHIVSTPGSETAGLAQEIGFIDSSAFAEIQSLGYKLSGGDPDQPYTIGNLIENYAIASPTKPPKTS